MLLFCPHGYTFYLVSLILPQILLSYGTFKANFMNTNVPLRLRLKWIHQSRGQSSIETCTSILVQAEDMKCFFSFLRKMRSTLKRDGAICVIPPPEWRDSSPDPNENTLETAGEPVLPHSPFASLKPHLKVLQR